MISLHEATFEEIHVFAFSGVGAKETASRIGWVNRGRRSVKRSLAGVEAVDGGVVIPRIMNGRKIHGTDEEEEARK